MAEVVEEGVSGMLAEPDDVPSLARAIEGCIELDRWSVRASAMRRLALDSTLDRYEVALEGGSR